MKIKLKKFGKKKKLRPSGVLLVWNEFGDRTTPSSWTKIFRGEFCLPILVKMAFGIVSERNKVY